MNRCSITITGDHGRSRRPDLYRHDDSRDDQGEQTR